MSSCFEKKNWLSRRWLQIYSHTCLCSMHSRLDVPTAHTSDEKSGSLFHSPATSKLLKWFFWLLFFFNTTYPLLAGRCVWAATSLWACCQLSRLPFSVAQDTLTITILKEGGHVWPSQPPNVDWAIGSQKHPKCILDTCGHRAAHLWSLSTHFNANVKSGDVSLSTRHFLNFKAAFSETGEEAGESF